jgi:site-specific recombinase XerD
VVYIREHGGSKYIWTSQRESGLFTIEEFRNRYRSVMKKIPGITYYPPHCCRHTYITNLQANHVPMELISQLAGHEDVSTTLGYTHISLDTLKEAVESLNESDTAEAGVENA